MNRNPDQLPDEIYFRWDVTQARVQTYFHIQIMRQNYNYFTNFDVILSQSECCGIDGPSDWTFSIFKDGNPRYPMSCCDKNVKK